MLRNALLTAVGLALIGLARLGFNTVALRGLGERMSGELNVALSLGLVLSLPAANAVGPTVLRFMARARGQARPDTLGWLYRRTLLATIVVAVLTAAVALAFGRELASSRGIDAGLVVQAVVVSLVYVAYQFFRNVLYAVDRVQLYARLEVASGAVFFASLAVLVATGHGRYLLAAFVLGQTVFSLATLKATSAELAAPCAPGRRVAASTLVSFSAISLVGAVASQSVRELAVVLAPTAADLGGAAHLALSLSLLAPLLFLPRMFRTVFFAHSAELDGRGRRGELGASIGLASHYLLLVTLPACGVLMLGAAPLVTLFGGAVTPERLLVFRLLTVAVLFDVVATPSANALPGVGAVRAPSLAAVVALAVTLGVWLGLAPRFGLTALAAGILTSSVIKGGVPVLLARRLLGATLTAAPWTVAALALLVLAGLVALALWPHPVLVAAAYVVMAAPLVLRPLRPAAEQLRARLRRRTSPAAAGATPAV